MRLLSCVIMNKSFPITGFIYSWARRISLSPPHSPNFAFHPFCRQCPSKVLISFSPVARSVRGVAGVPISPLEEKYKRIDKIPDNFNLIYRNPMNTYIPFAHCIITGSTFIVLLCCGYNLFTSDVWQFDIEFLTFGSLFAVFNISAFYLVLQYIMRIYVSDDKYICVLPSLVPFRTSKLTYNAGDVKHVPPRGFLPWRYNRYKIHSKSVIILEYCFRRPVDFNNMIAR